MFIKVNLIGHFSSRFMKFSHQIPGFVNRGRARIYTYLLLFWFIRSRSAKNKAETEALKAKSREQIVATALRCSGLS